MSLVPSPPSDATSAARGLVSTGQQAFGGGKVSPPVALTSTGGHVAIDLALGNDFVHALTENTVLDNPTNDAPGQAGSIAFDQHASSPKTLTLGSAYKSVGAAAFPGLTATNSAKDTLYYRVRAAGFVEYHFSKGYG